MDNPFGSLFSPQPLRAPAAAAPVSGSGSRSLLGGVLPAILVPLVSLLGDGLFLGARFFLEPYVIRWVALGDGNFGFCPSSLPTVACLGRFFASPFSSSEKAYDGSTVFLENVSGALGELGF